MKKKLFALFLALMLPLCALAEEPLPQWDWDFKGTKIAAEYDSPSLKFTVERFDVGTDLEGSDHFPIFIDLTPAE